VAAIAQVNAAPLIDEVKYSMIHYQLGFTLTEILRIVLFQHLIPHAVNYAVAAVFYTFAAALMVLCPASGP